MPQESILDYPLGVFNFEVNFTLARENSSDSGERNLCAGAFSECTGLDATMEPKTIKEGGRNYGEIQRVGRTNFATVVLKRGVTKNRDLWEWFFLVTNGGYSYRLDAEIKQLAYNRSEELVPIIAWRMKKALPVKCKTADYNSTFTQIAIEELHFVHEGLTHELLQQDDLT